ncbi:hypothetical protein GCM10020331_047510 [Ectobacillus funiculus]
MLKKVRGISAPRVGLLNVGTEDGKGNELTKQTFDLLKNSSLNFVGNVEARDLLEGAADVVVSDGFTGNIALKALEGAALSVFFPAEKKAADKLVYQQAGGSNVKAQAAWIKEANGLF